MEQTYISLSSFQSTPSQKPEVHADGQIGLSYSPYLTVLSNKRIHIKRFATGETCVSTHEVYKPNLGESRQKPPKNEGERVVEGLSRRGRSRLRRSANYYDMLQGENGHKTMITLTYGNTSKSGHKESKADLDRFIKSFSRYVKKTYNTEDVHYVWVAEIQPKRKKRTGEDVIHYHMMTIYYVPSGLISKWWNNAVNRPRRKANLPTQKLLPNVISCWNAGAYMAKYLSKESHKIKGNSHSMSQATSKGIEPIFNECVDVPEGQVEYLYDKLFNTSKHLTHYRHDDESGLPRMMWIPESNDYAFSELINNARHEQHEPK
jgi:hypothetical protein